jgi:hypothetical protein
MKTPKLSRPRVNPLEFEEYSDLSRALIDFDGGKSVVFNELFDRACLVFGIAAVMYILIVVAKVVV